MTAAVEVPILSFVPVSVAAVLFASAKMSIVTMPMPIYSGICELAFVFVCVAMSIALAVRVMLTLAHFMSRSMTVIRE
jgi:hypothetical protein